MLRKWHFQGIFSYAIVYLWFGDSIIMQNHYAEALKILTLFVKKPKIKYIRYNISMRKKYDDAIINEVKRQ